jgi:hypothetical protein
MVQGCTIQGKQIGPDGAILLRLEQHNLKRFTAKKAKSNNQKALAIFSYALLHITI